MALELNTDGTTQAATTGNTAVNLAGNYAATVLGATFQWCAAVFGAYTAFTRIVTGVAIDIVVGAKIDIFGGYKLEAHGSVVTKFVRGNHYTWDVAQKFEQHTEKTTTADKKTLIANELNQTINSAILTYAQGVDVKAGGDVTSNSTSHSTTCTGDIKLDSFNKMAITGNTLALVGSSKLTLASLQKVTISAPAKVTVGGAIINLN